VLDTGIFEWENLLAANKGRQPNTSKISIQDQNKLRKGLFYIDTGSQVGERLRQGCA